MTLAERLRNEGREKGLTEGREKGLTEGTTRGRREMLLKQLALKFGTPSAETQARVEAADAATLDRWAERLLTASSLSDLLE